MYSNPRMLTHENAPINMGIKSVYPELSQYSRCFKEGRQFLMDKKGLKLRQIAGS